MKKVLITGGEGVLAGYLKKALGRNYKVYAPSKTVLDITKRKNLENFFNKNKPQVIIHLAAKTNVDECEKNPKETFLVNAEGTKYLAELCLREKVKMVYISTAAIFNGQKEKFYEDDSPDPVNIYGESKLLGEEYVKNSLNDFLIIRSGWLIGGGVKQRKFVSIIIEKAKTQDEIAIANDKFGTLTSAKELADFIKVSLKLDRKGVYHFGSKGVCSRYDIAKKILTFLKSEVRLVAVPSRYFAKVYPAPRPNREVLGSRKVKFPFTWQKSLKDYFYKEIISK